MLLCGGKKKMFGDFDVQQILFSYAGHVQGVS